MLYEVITIVTVMMPAYQPMDVMWHFLPKRPIWSAVTPTGHPIFLRQIESAHGLGEDFLNGARHQGDGGVVAMGAPHGLHDVGLAGAGRHPGGGATAHDVDNDAGNFGDAGISYNFV